MPLYLFGFLQKFVVSLIVNGRFQIAFGEMVLIPGKTVTRPFHKILSFYVQLTETVDDDVDMDITGAIVSIRMSTDDGLVAGKVLGSIF